MDARASSMRMKLWHVRPTIGSQGGGGVYLSLGMVAGRAPSGIVSGTSSPSLGARPSSVAPTGIVISSGNAKL